MNNDLSNINFLKEDYKRERKHNAIKLPIELKQELIPKYVTYYKECYNIEKKLYREFFKIEKHPNMIKNKVYISSKSNKINILEKLEEINKILEKLNKNNNNEEKIQNNENNNNEENNINNNNEENNNGENNNEENIENKIKLPKYISLKNHEKDNNKYYLIYDKKTHNNRISLKTICSKSYSFIQNLNLFLEKIENKLNNLQEK